MKMVCCCTSCCRCDYQFWDNTDSQECSSCASRRDRRGWTVCRTTAARSSAMDAAARAHTHLVAHVVPQQLPAQLAGCLPHDCCQGDRTAQLDCRGQQLLRTKPEGRRQPLRPVGARQLAAAGYTAKGAASMHAKGPAGQQTVRRDRLTHLGTQGEGATGGGRQPRLHASRLTAEVMQLGTMRSHHLPAASSVAATMAAHPGCTELC